MKIEVLQEQILEGLNIVSRAVAVRAQLPVLSHILIEAKSEGLVLSATDLELAIKVKVSAKVVEPGVVAVPAKLFGEFLSTLNPGKVEITSEGETLKLSAPGYNGKFQTISAEEFPAVAELTAETEIGKLEANVFKQAIERVVFASAKDSLRPVLTGVLCGFEKKSISMVATDGFRLAIESLPLAEARGEMKLLVPARVVLEVVRLAKDSIISVGHLAKTNQIYFVVEDVQIVSQLLDGNFPDYQKILPKEFTSEITVQKDELLQAIKATHIFARDNSNMVRWSVEKNKLTLRSSSPERGECVVEVPMSLEGDSVEVVFNAKYVLDYLSITEGEQLWVGLGGKLAPGMFKDVKRASGQYIVMPINA